jgi:NADPH:quinone reductase-like Zn-dependent oxidoreductase
MTMTHPTADPDLSPAESMLAIVQDAYGEADQALRVARIARPDLGPDDVLVRVEAAGVDQGVWHLMTGLPYPIRIAGYGLRAPKNRVRGGDLAGRVAAVGSAVTGLRVGDEVYGFGAGTFAQYTIAPSHKLAPKPANLTFEQAAAVPVSGLTALQAVRRAGVTSGQQVLVLGASGGVGSFAVQIAKSAGAVVTGVASGAKLDLVRALGADRALDYNRDDLTGGDGGYDVIVDVGGNRTVSALRRLLAASGTLVITGGEGGGRWLGGTDRQLRAIAMSPFLRQRLGTFIANENAADLRALTELIESGQVTPALDRSYPLAEAPNAINDLRSGRIRGKAVVLPWA